MFIYVICLIELVYNWVSPRQITQCMKMTHLRSQ